MSTSRSTAIVVALAAWSGCGGDDPLPSELLPDQLSIMRQAASAQPLERQSASVWAVKGVATTLEITYRTLVPDQGGKEFLRLDVPADALFIGPSGGLFQPGDSVRITISGVGALENPVEVV